MNKYKRTRAVWYQMKYRCDNPNYAQYKDYGGRGISYDPDWADFKNFARDMGFAPLGLTLERRDNAGNYSKHNCCWATWAEQARNKRKRTVKLTPKSDNTTGIAGVGLYARKSGTVFYRVRASDNGRRLVLYQGLDFFEACCRRKSYEAARS